MLVFCCLEHVDRGLELGVVQGVRVLDVQRGLVFIR